MLVIAEVELECAVTGTVARYEVSAQVDAYDGQYEVGEPEFSEPEGHITDTKLDVDPQSGGVFVDGWSAAVEEALIDAYRDFCADNSYENGEE